MSPRHHLDPATLVSHAAGALSAAMAAVAATHLEGCAHCRLARLQQPLPAAAAEPAPAPMHRPAELLPRALHPYFGRTWKALRWRWVAPGVHLVRAAAGSGDTLVMLKIAPGKSIPLHSHHGSELTQILQGAYDDELGHFGPGDMADLDSDIEHRPITSPGVPCVCVAALDGPLQFRGWLARKMQPMVGL